MTAVHVRGYEDRAVGEAIRRLQEELGQGVAAAIELRGDGHPVRVVVYGIDGRPLAAESGTDIEDCCDAALASWFARADQ